MALQLSDKLSLPDDAVTQTDQDAARRERLREYYRRYRAAHPHLKAYHARYYRANKGKWGKPPTEEQKAKRRARWATNRQRHSEKRRAAWAANPERYRSAARKHRLRNPEKKRARDRKFRRNHPDKYKAAIDAARVANPELYRLLDRAKASRRRSRIRAAGVEPVSLSRIFARDQMRCHLCGLQIHKADVSIDHLIPVARKGPFAEWNLMSAHLLCNQRRGNTRILTEETKDAALAYIAKKLRGHQR